jgi:hypothetical protein
MSISPEMVPKEESQTSTREVPEETFMEIQELVLAYLLGEGDPEQVSPEAALDWVKFPLNAEFSRSEISAYLATIDWQQIDWKNPDDEAKVHLKEMSDRLLVATGGSIKPNTPLRAN